MFTKLKSSWMKRKNFVRNLYHVNDELFNLSVERLRESVRNRKNKQRAKLLNLIVNGYGLRMFRRRFGFDYSDRFLKPGTQSSIFADHSAQMTAETKEKSYVERFQEKLADADVVTFDIFDTLLVRKISQPTDAFRLIEAMSSDNKGFAEERMRAERRARRLKHEEILIEDIYETILPKYRHLMSEELDLESKLLHRNDAAYVLYERALAAGKRIAVVSDMYLPKTFLRDILVREGYDRIEEVFVSGEIRKSKCVRGELFVHAAETLGTETGRILHVGDNAHSDVEMAKEVGCSAVRIPMARQLFEESPDARFRMRDDTMLAGSIHNALIRTYRDDGDYFRKLGFMLGGPLALAYITWLDREIRLAGADCALFIARDGWLLRQLWGEYFNKTRIRTGYVYLNRILGLKAFTTYLDEPHYLAILLRRAHKYLGTPQPTENFKNNLKIFEAVRPQLCEWGKDLLREMQTHVDDEAQNASRIVTIDMGTGRFASLSFAKRLLGKRLINSFFFMTVNDYLEKAVYQAFLPHVATSRDVHVANEHVHGGEINLMELMEILISSPEPRVIDIKDGKAVYDGTNDCKAFYSNIEKGIREYFDVFFGIVEPNVDNTVSAENWLDYARSFVCSLNEEDLRELACIEFCAAADNETGAHKPFVPAVKS